MAQTVYLAAVAVIFAALVLAGVFDAGLAAANCQTISDWLRLHPLYYWIPVGVTLAFLCALTVHLFV